MADQEVKEVIANEQGILQEGMHAWVRVYWSWYEDRDDYSVTQNVRFFEKRPDEIWRRTTVDFFTTVQSITINAYNNSSLDTGCQIEICIETDSWENEMKKIFLVSGINIWRVSRYRRNEAGNWKSVDEGWK